MLYLIARDLVGEQKPVSKMKHPFGPCGYRYCDWPDGELRCNEPRYISGAVTPPLLVELRRRVENLTSQYSLYSGKRSAIQDVLMQIDIFAQEKKITL